MSGKCPICDEALRSGLCPVCGYDESRDYERWPTLQVIPDGMRAMPVQAGIIDVEMELSRIRAEEDPAKRRAICSGWYRAAGRGSAAQRRRPL